MAKLKWQRVGDQRTAVVDDNHTVRITEWIDPPLGSVFSVVLGLTHLGSAGTIAGAKEIAENNPRIRKLLDAAVPS